MLTLLIPAIACASISDADLVRTATNFRQSAIASARPAKASDISVEHDRTSPDYVVVKFPDCRIAFMGDRIRSFLAYTPIRNKPWPDQVLKGAELSRIVMRYAGLAGFTGSIRILSSKEVRNQNPSFVEVHCVPSYKGVWFGRENDLTFDVSPDSGDLIEARFTSPPKAPANISSSLDPQRVRDAVISYLFSNARAKGTVPPEQVEESTAPELCISLVAPSPDDPNSFLDTAQRDAVAKGEGLLCWFTEVEDPSSFNPAIGRCTRMFDGYVDAKSGKLLRFIDYTGMTLGPTPAAPKSVGWSWQGKPQTIRILANGKVVVVSRSQIAPAGTKAAGSLSTYDLVLRIGKTSVPARYDLSSGLLAVRSGKSDVLGRPDQGTARALRRLVSKR